jgi:hypothetical protein
MEGWSVAGGIDGENVIVKARLGEWPIQKSTDLFYQTCRRGRCHIACRDRVLRLGHDVGRG